MLVDRDTRRHRVEQRRDEGHEASNSVTLAMQLPLMELPLLEASWSSCA